MASFLSSLADRAQAAVNASPLGAHIPHNNHPTSPGTDSQNVKPGASPFSQLDAIQHQIKSFGQQYSSASPVQKIITTEKGVAIDFDSISKDAKTQSKELYTWGQAEPVDLKDVTDRLAYFNFVHGSLAGSLAIKLDAARAPFKALRDAETAITPRRNIRAGIALTISRMEHDQAKGTEQRLAETRAQLRRYEEQDEAQEKQIEILKRKALRDSEQLKWEAIREYAEKLVLISQAAPPVISVLPSVPPSDAEPYKGAQTTAATRASLQRALDNYKTGRINLAPDSPTRDDSDTRSFGESHASELSSMVSAEGTISAPGIPLTPPQPNNSLPPPPSSSATQSPPLNPAQLNHTPAPIPILTSAAVVAASSAPIVSPDAASVGAQLPPITPTVAETGLPVSAGEDGPGPASGSLLDIKGAAASAGPKSGGLPGNQPAYSGYGQGASFADAGVTSGNPTAGKFESAEDEKKRLQREERERVLSAQGPPPFAAFGQKFESAEEEKKRLEREERERILRAGGNGPSGDGQGPPKGGNDDSELPPSYQAF